VLATLPGAVGEGVEGFLRPEIASLPVLATMVSRTSQPCPRASMNGHWNPPRAPACRGGIADKRYASGIVVPLTQRSVTMPLY
jgi:hypothetical protein